MTMHDSMPEGGSGWHERWEQDREPDRAERSCPNPEPRSSRGTDATTRSAERRTSTPPREPGMSAPRESEARDREAKEHEAKEQEVKEHEASAARERAATASRERREQGLDRMEASAERSAARREAEARRVSAPVARREEPVREEPKPPAASTHRTGDRPVSSAGRTPAATRAQEHTVDRMEGSAERSAARRESAATPAHGTTTPRGRQEPEKASPSRTSRKVTETRVEHREYAVDRSVGRAAEAGGASRKSPPRGDPSSPRKHARKIGRAHV